MTKYVKLNSAAKSYGVHFRTILNWAKSGKINYIVTNSGVKQYQLPDCQLTSKKIIGYVRVSSYSQKEHLQSQTKLLLAQYPTAEIVTESASGLNFRRKKLWNLVESAIAGDVGCVVVTHKDRLARFGFEFIQKLLERFECKLVVLNQIITSPEQELVNDILSIIHVFSSRLYGLRKYKDELKNLSNQSQLATKKAHSRLDESVQTNIQSSH
jgi:predicted site-specific integrase-resolvase